MLKAYLDRGAREDAEGVMCVAVALFKPIKYKPFCREWNKWLGPLPYLHATDFYSGGGIYKGLDRDERAKMAAQLPALIDAHVMQVMCVSFLEDEFQAVAPPNWKARFGSTHRIAVQLCLDVLGHHLDRIGNSTPVAYFIETGDDDESQVDRLFKQIVSDSERKRLWRYHSHTFADKGTARGLEVADNFAWHWDKYFAETVSNPIREMRRDLKELIRRNPKKYRVFPFHRDALGDLLVEHGCTRPVPPGVVSDEPALS